MAADDAVTNAAESTNVTLSLSGIDADASSVSVAIADGRHVNADASYGESGWVVADQDLSGLADGTLTVTASVTDAAGNSADAVSDTLTLDTTADLEDDTDLAVSVDTVINEVESGNVTLTLSGVDADADSVTVTLTDDAGTAVQAAAVAGNNGDWTVDVSGGALIDGNVSVAVDMTDDAGNTASAATGFDLDTTADADTNLAVTVAASDEVTNLTVINRRKSVPVRHRRRRLGVSRLRSPTEAAQSVR